VNDPADIRAALDATTTWFVVGLGDNPARDAYGVARLLQTMGKRIVPIHPRAEVVHGEQGYRTIADAVTAVGPPDVVDVFVRSDRAGAFADEAVAAGAKVVWFQLGVIDDGAAQRVEAAGRVMVMDRCPAIELRRPS
jgi:predicted CoA-binding protein